MAARLGGSAESAVVHERSLATNRASYAPTTVKTRRPSTCVSTTRVR